MQKNVVFLNFGADSLDCESTLDNLGINVKWATKPKKKSEDYRKKKLPTNTIIIKRRKR